MFCDILTENFPRSVFLVLKSFALFVTGMNTHQIDIYFEIFSLEYCDSEGNLANTFFRTALGFSLYLSLVINALFYAKLPSTCGVDHVSCNGWYILLNTEILQWWKIINRNLYPSVTPVYSIHKIRVCAIIIFEICIHLPSWDEHFVFEQIQLTN